MADQPLHVFRVPAFTPRVSVAGKRASSVPDYTTEAGARRLAARIEQLWHDLGHTDVRAYVERSVYRRDASSDVRFDVRTNLLNGLPPSVAARSLAQ